MKGVGHWCIGESTYAFKGYEENSLNWKSQIEEGEPRKLLFYWRNLQIGPLTWRINHFLLQFFTISQKSLCTCTSLCWLGEYTMESKLISIRILIWIYNWEFQITDGIIQSCLLKFRFSRNATKIDEIFTADLTLCSKCQIDGEDFVIFCGLLRKHELYLIISRANLPPGFLSNITFLFQLGSNIV